MDVLKLLQDCIKTFNLDVSNLRDIAFAICTADKMDGTNKRELDVDKFVESDTELSWDSILTALGVEPQTKGYTKLPRVQKLRVISDVLSLSLSDKVDNLVLSCDASKKVSKILGVSLPSEDYADEDACYENLKKIEHELTYSNFIKDTEIVEILDLLETYKVELPRGITNLDEHYVTNDNQKSYFKICTSDKFIKREFVKDLNCHLINQLIELEDYKWITLYDIFSTFASHLNGNKLVYCITPELNSRLCKCHRLNNGIKLIGKCSYSVFDYTFVKILLIATYSSRIVDDLKYI